MTFSPDAGFVGDPGRPRDFVDHGVDVLAGIVVCGFSEPLFADREQLLVLGPRTLEDLGGMVPFEGGGEELVDGELGQGLLARGGVAGEVPGVLESFGLVLAEGAEEVSQRREGRLPETEDLGELGAEQEIATCGEATAIFPDVVEPAPQEGSGDRW